MVCLLIKRFHPVVGGAETQARLFGRWLGDHGVNVTVLTLRWQPDWPAAETLDGLIVRRLSPRIWPLALALALWRGRRRFSVVQSLGSTAAFNGWGETVCRMLRLPVVARLESGSDLAVLPQRRWGGWRLALLRRNRTIVCISDCIRRQLLANGFAAETLQPIPNAVALEFYQIPPRPARTVTDRFTAVFVGRLVALKGIDVLLRAWEMVVARHPAARLLIVGGADRAPDSVEADSRQTAQAPGLQQTVEFMGQQASVARYLSQADAFVFPSHTEGHPVALLEAMASGLPVVATRIPGVTDSVTHEAEGLLVPPGDPAALAEALLRLVAEPEWASRLGQAARQRAQAYSIDAIGPQYLRLFQRCQ